MACLNSSDTEGPFRDALKNATRFMIAGDRLTLFDAANTPLAVFTANRHASASPTPSLDGTSWQLVRFQGSDGRTLTPDDRAKYTIEFDSSGRLIAHIDCNSGRGTWKLSGPNQIEFGPLALTRVQCPPGSLYDQIVRQWESVRSYTIKDNHLFLSLMTDAGTYEFEPIARATPPGSDEALPKPPASKPKASASREAVAALRETPARPPC
jgi:heat shock protein HslJ